jgi:hypothetical protein
MASVKKEEARAILSQYDGWVKKHPDDATTTPHGRLMLTVLGASGGSEAACGWRDTGGRGAVLPRDPATISRLAATQT